MSAANEPNYLELSEDQIDLILANSLLAGSLGAKEFSDEEKKEVARNWFRARLDWLRENVCNKGLANTVVGPDKESRNVLFGMIVDVVEKLHGVPVPVGALSAKLLHYGISKLCASSKAETGPGAGAS
jgi:hypothetical protein